MHFQRSRSRASVAASSRPYPLPFRSLRGSSLGLIRGLPAGLLPCISACTTLFTCLSSPTLLRCPNHFILALFGFKDTGGWKNISLMSTFLTKSSHPTPTVLLNIPISKASNLLSSVCYCQCQCNCSVQKHRQYDDIENLYFDLQAYFSPAPHSLSAS